MVGLSPLPAQPQSPDAPAILLSSREASWNGLSAVVPVGGIQCPVAC